MDNTTGAQDRDIETAKRNVSSVEADVGALVDIIAAMDSEISQWKEASGCSEPGDLEIKLSNLQS